ncbi:MAG: hypothetical protein GWP70_09880 [Proteobacteria bacterium]|nr:hypothetical protein [Pseudomonadota bacterium]
MRNVYFAGIAIAIASLLWLTTGREDSKISRLSSDPLPDFGQYQNVVEKKRAFFDYLRPLISSNNEQVLAHRTRLSAIAIAPLSELSRSERSFTQMLIERYEVDETLAPAALRAELLNRLDIVPVSLALSQAAKESAWGTSRFARQGNNLFGQWCYEKGCGLVPLQRGAGQVHEVARFASVNDAVASYLRNINSHRAYSDLRSARAAMRAQGQTINGLALAAHLTRYSERGQAYVDEIQSMIRFNKLDALDTPSPA